MQSSPPCFAWHVCLDVFLITNGWILHQSPDLCTYLYSCMFKVQDITAVSENKFLAEIANADDVNHIVVFMTGAVAFPEGMGASGKTSLFMHCIIVFIMKESISN